MRLEKKHERGTKRGDIRQYWTNAYWRQGEGTGKRKRKVRSDEADMNEGETGSKCGGKGSGRGTKADGKQDMGRKMREERTRYMGILGLSFMV